MLEEIDDISLVKLVQDSNHSAFAMLVKRHSKLLYGVAYRYTANRAEAEDVVQGALLKFWEHPYKFNTSLNVPFKAWIVRVAINLAIDKGRRKRPTVDVYETMISYEDKTDDSIHQKRLSLKLENAIAKLPERQRTALNLGMYEEMPYNEVAVIMNTSLKSVQSLIMRAKENLKKHIGDGL